MRRLGLRIKAAGYVATLIAAAAASAQDGAEGAKSAPAASADRAKFPDTIAARRLADWLEAFNAAERDALLAWNTRHMAASTRAKISPEDKTEMDLRGAAETGGVEVATVRSASPHEASAVVKTRNGGEWLEVMIHLEEAEPHGVDRFGVRPATPPDGSGPARATNDAELAERLGDEMETLAEAGRFSGVVLVARGDQPVFRGAYGLADRETEQRNRIDTKFNLASMNKMFTAVAIAQLAEAGRLSLDDKVGRHLPDYPDRKVADEVTIRQLLTHTSGLGSYWNERYEEAKRRIDTVDEFLATFAGDPLKFEPGEGWEYSNAGFIVLGKIIEEVSDEDYYDYVRRHIFEPAGMADTASYLNGSGTPNRAKGYSKASPTDEAWTDNDEELGLRGGPAGGGYSTAPDLLKFARALLDGKLVSKEMACAMTSAQADTRQGPGQAYGFGFQVETEDGRTTFGHSGGSPGVSCKLEVDPEADLIWIILSNQDRAGPPALAKVRAIVPKD